MVKKKKLDLKQKSLKESAEKTVKDLCGFSELNCRCCGKGNDEIGGFLLQCATCKKAHYCSKECFNKDLPKHMEFCQTNEPLHRAPKHRMGQPVNLSSTDQLESLDDSFCTDAETKSCSASTSEGENLETRTVKESSSSGFLKGLNETSDATGTKSNACGSDDAHSTVERTEFDKEGKAVFPKNKLKGKRSKRKEDKAAVIAEEHNSQLKVESIASKLSNTIAKDETTLFNQDNPGAVLCLDFEDFANNCGLRKPQRSTSLSPKEDQHKCMSDSIGSTREHISDSSIHMSDMTESEGDDEYVRCKNSRITLRRGHEPTSIDSAIVKPIRSESSSSLDRSDSSLKKKSSHSEKSVICDDGEDADSRDVNSNSATSDSYSKSNITSRTILPYELQRKEGFIVRRQKANGGLSHEDDCSRNGGGNKNEVFGEETRMRKRLNNLWSLPEATIMEKSTDKRVKLQLSRSMRREKGRMHRCLGNLWKLSAASKADEENSGLAYSDWSDLEDSDCEEIRKRRGGGALGFGGSLTESSPKRAAPMVTLKHLEVSEPKYIGWERPEWTEFQLRSTAEGEVIKNAGNLAAFKSHANDKPEWARYSSLRKISIGSNLISQKSFNARSNQSLSRPSTNQSIKASNFERSESFRKLKATERGTMLKRVGSIRLSNRRNALCEFSMKRSTSSLSRSSSGSISFVDGTRKKTNVVELNENENKDNISQKVFDRKQILRTTSRGVKLLRGESLRKNHEFQTLCLP